MDRTVRERLEELEPAVQARVSETLWVHVSDLDMPRGDMRLDLRVQCPNSPEQREATMWLKAPFLEGADFDGLVRQIVEKAEELIESC